MFAYVKGKLEVVEATCVIVDVQGIGYSIFIPCRMLSELPEVGQMIRLHTAFVVREFSQALYGFLDIQERNLFEVLINVSGIGPKLALSLIGHLTFAELQSAIALKDLKSLCLVPGVGKKTAERLVVELKDKLSQMVTVTEGVKALSMSTHDAVLALMNLGYSQSVAQKAIKQSLEELPSNVDLGVLITTALKKT